VGQPLEADDFVLGRIVGTRWRSSSSGIGPGLRRTYGFNALRCLSRGSYRAREEAPFVEESRW